MRRLPAYLAVVVAAIVVTGCNLFDEYSVENRTDSVLLVKVERSFCHQGLVYSSRGWSIVDPGSTHRGRIAAGDEVCLVVTDLHREQVETARLDDGARYVLRDRGSSFVIQRSGGDYTATEVELSTPHADQGNDASPRLLWVIGLPALLSIAYLAYAGIHFLFPGNLRPG